MPLAHARSPAAKTQNAASHLLMLICALNVERSRPRRTRFLSLESKQGLLTGELCPKPTCRRDARDMLDGMTRSFQAFSAPQPWLVQCTVDM
jgi:hypothetical protein